MSYSATATRGHISRANNYSNYGLLRAIAVLPEAAMHSRKLEIRFHLFENVRISPIQV